MKRPHSREFFRIVLMLFLGFSCSPEAFCGTTLVPWGDNYYGQTSLPPGLTNVVAIAGSGSHHLALNRDGTVVGWGWNSYGQTNVPAGLSNVVAIAAGSSHSMALGVDGAVTAWGWNFYGQTNVPPGLTNVVALDGGGSHSLVLQADGTIVAWGNNDYGQSTVPAGLGNVVAMAGGGWHSLALKADGRVVAWGYNSYGQTNVPADLTNVVAVSAGALHSVALTAEGTVMAWGNNDYGQGDVPPGLSNVVAIAAGDYHSLALKADGTVVAWGFNFSGQTNVPVGLSKVVAIAERSLALLGDGAPFLTTPLVNRSGIKGQTVLFQASATGAWPLSYQWQFAGSALPGQTNRVLLLQNVQPEQAGLYSVSVSNAFGAAESPTSLLTVAPLLAFASPPRQATWLGGTAHFQAAVEGVPPVTVQWYLGGALLVDSVRIQGASSAHLSITNAQLSDSGEYQVVASNAFGAVTSRVAVLVVTNRLPILTCQPLDQTVGALSNASFRVCVSSDYEYTVRWYHDGAPVPGAISSLLQLHNVSTNAAGTYWCEVSNVDGAVTSRVATLTVLAYPAQIDSDLRDLTVYAGTNFDWAIQASGTPPLRFQWQKEGLNLLNATNAYLRFALVSTNHAGNYRVIVSNAWSVVTSAVARLTVLLPPPTMIAQPVSQTNDWGTRVTFAVSANNGPILSYQWQKDGLDIPGANNNILSLPSVTTSDQGGYRVILANSGGSVTSAVATLTVLIRPPVLSQNPQGSTILVNSTYTFSTYAEGARPLYYQWFLNGQAIPGANASSYTIYSALPSHQGSYQVIITNFVGAVTSAVALLAVQIQPPQVSWEPQNQTNDLGLTAYFVVQATGTQPLRFQWLFNGVPIPEATNNILYRFSVTTNDEGNYQALVSNIGGSVTSRVAFLKVVIRAPVITQQSQDLTLELGQSVGFYVNALGALPLFYQWYFNGQPIARATNLTFYISPIASESAGNYSVVVSNFVGSTTSAVMHLTVTVAPPTILMDPASQSVDWGSTAYFYVSVVGTRPLFSQWQHDGTNIPNGINEVLMLPNISGADGGQYRVIITNAAGAATSQVATLTVVTRAPEIITPPAELAVYAGENACFSASVPGAPSPAFQWQFNGQNLAGATNVPLCLSSVSSNQAGVYRLIASNIAGVVTSTPATLYVLYGPPEFTTSPYNQSVWAGEYVTLRCVARGGPSPALQWLFNGNLIPGETGFYYSFWAGSTNQSGDYSVLASNVFGMATSTVAHVTVQATLPTFYLHPLSRGAVAGNPCVFSAAASGYPPPLYQWYVDGQPLAGATNQNLYLSSVRTNDAGSYACVANNEAGSKTSKVATLLVSLPGPVDRWEWRRPLPQGNDLLCAAYGAGRFVAFGKMGARVVSTNNGITWQSYSQSEASIAHGAYGNGVFVVTGYSETGATSANWLQTSPDGIHWTNHAAPPLSALAFGNGKFLAANESGGLSISTNGAQWSLVENAPECYIEQLHFANGLFAAVCDSYTFTNGARVRTFATSSDGITWTNTPVVTPDDVLALDYGNGTWVVMGRYYTNYALAYTLASKDGLTWTPGDMSEGAYVTSLAFGNGRFVAVSDYSPRASAVSSDGIHWKILPPPVVNDLYALTYGSGQFLAVGDKGAIITSTNGESWSIHSAGSATNLRALTHGQNKYVAVGNDGLLLVSSNGVSWTQPATLTAANVRSIAYGNGRFVAVGDVSTNAALMLSSSNGWDWTAVEVFPGYNFYSVAYGKGLFVAAGWYGAIATSTDGIAWTFQNSGATERLNAITFDGTNFIAVGRQGRILVSTNALQWEARFTLGGNFLQGVACGNGVVVGAGTGGGISVSTNTVEWTSRLGDYSPFGYTDIEDVQFANGVFMAAGADGVFYTSRDGAIWTPHRTGSQNTFRSVHYANGYVFAVGNNETILQSDFFGPPILRVKPTLYRGGFELAVDAEVGGNYRLQASDDLRNWEDIFTFSNTRVSTTFLDTEAGMFPRQFYRVVSAP